MFVHEQRRAKKDIMSYEDNDAMRGALSAMRYTIDLQSAHDSLCYRIKVSVSPDPTVSMRSLIWCCTARMRLKVNGILWNKIANSAAPDQTVRMRSLTISVCSQHVSKRPCS